MYTHTPLVTIMVLKVTTELNFYYQQLLQPPVNWLNEQSERLVIMSHLISPEGPSLRLIDYMVLQYAKSVPILLGEVGQVPADLWNTYKTMLMHTGKEYFDVFKRKHPLRIELQGVALDSTMGQIIFFKWFISNNLHAYLSQHLHEIREHMQAKITRTANTKRSIVTIQKQPESTRAKKRGKLDVVKPMAQMYMGSFLMEWS